MRIETATTAGRVRGRRDGPVVAFRGIPYARPPTGPRRLQPPAPPAPWSGVADTTAFGNAALQLPPDGIAARPALAIGPQGEDCLSLNVFTPALDGERRPVLVWLHGGGFDWGAGSQGVFDGSRLAHRAEAVVVTVNYRLGALGFAPLAAVGAGAAVPANLGLLDQVEALAWVRANAKAFGGDPDNVTLFGESAGAMSIAALLAMPRAAGLFHKAILQSGSLQPLHDAESAALVAHELLDELWLTPDELDGLRHVPARSILLAQRRVSLRLRTSHEWLTWRPLVDGEVLPCAPADAIRSGAGRGIPLLVGTNRDECRPVALLDPRLRAMGEEALAARIRAIGPYGTDPGRIAAAYRRTVPAEGGAAAIASALETDVHFRLPAIRLAEIQARHERRTFMYRFDWPSPAFGGLAGACHGVEVPFVFGRTDAEGVGDLVGDGPEARALADRMMDAWGAFAHHGEPQSAGGPAWPAYEPALRATLRFGRSCGVEHDPGGIERRAWAVPEGEGPARSRTNRTFRPRIGERPAAAAPPEPDAGRS